MNAVRCLLLLLLLACAPGFAATQVQATDNNDGSFSSLAFGSNVTSGNLLIACLRVSTGDGTPSGLTDSVGTSYSQVGSSVSISGGIGYCYAGVAGGSGANTVSISGGATARIEMEEVSGLTSATLDQSNQATGTGTAASSGNITTTAATWIHAFLVLTNYPSVAVTVGAGFASINIADGNKYAGESRDAASTGTYAGTFTLPESNTWGAIVVAFKAAGGGGTNLLMKRRRH